MNLGFVCEWNKDRIKTWSSTPYFLFNELAGIDGVNMVDINVMNRFCAYQFNTAYRRYLQLLLKAKSGKSDLQAVIEIGDIGILDTDYYLYQDLSVSLLLEIYRSRPEIYKYSGFGNITADRLEKRLACQQKIYDRCAGVFVFSEYLASHLKTRGILPEEKIHVVNAGVNVKPGKRAVTDEAGTPGSILFVGRDFFRKGGDLLVEAFKVLRAEYDKRLRLVVAGPQKWPMSGNIPEGIDFIGDAGMNTLAECYERADVFCLPSRFEAFGIAVIEALCFGVPCVVRNDFAMKELVSEGKNGYLINRDDRYELAECIKNALENRSLRRYLSENRDELAHKYSWSAVAKKMYGIVGRKT